MTTNQLISECCEIIHRHSARTQNDYAVSVTKFNLLYDNAQTDFEKQCIVAAHTRLWCPDELTLINLFEDIGIDPIY